MTGDLVVLVDVHAGARQQSDYLCRSICEATHLEKMAFADRDCEVHGIGIVETVGCDCRHERLDQMPFEGDFVPDESRRYQRIQV